MKSNKLLSCLAICIFTCKSYSQTTLVLQPDSVLGKDAWLALYPPDNYENRNWGNLVNMSIHQWTAGGTTVTARGLLQFDLTALPADALITSAKLSLYANSGGHSAQSGSNEVLLQRVTDPWLESTVTWNTQPGTTTQNQVTLPASTSASQDYLNIEVTQLVKDMFASPTGNYGFLMKLKTEDYYRKMDFASSDHADANKHPRLEITYISPSAIKGISAADNTQIFPNPFTNILNINFQPGEVRCLIYNAFGSMVKDVLPAGPGQLQQIDLSILPAGIYYTVMESEHGAVTRKIVKK